MGSHAHDYEEKTMTQSTDNMNPQDAALIEVVGELRPGPGRWQPRVGSEALGLAGIELPSESRSTIIQEAVNILSRCAPPLEREDQETGLVIGYVQSGKTMSFTTVAALARDNGYRMVIVVAGTSRLLLGQSRDRLINDLRLNDRTELRPWRHVPDPTLAQSSHLVMRDVLEEWDDPTVPREEIRTILVTVMKHHSHLQNLIDVLRRINLRGVPTLIIDDEGDQAGLNTQARRGRGGQSTTYRRLLELKAVFLYHSYLQYTATPQAPLLINIIDVLSPSFAEVITPGEGYTGGREFFTGQESLVRIIPPGEIPSQDNPINSPPQSLLEALRLFFLGAAAHIVSSDQAPNRSMMVHPSRLTERHGQYFGWVTRAREGWIQILTQADNDPDRSDLLEQFRQDYAELSTTEPSLPSFESLVPRLLHALRRTTVREVNSIRSTLVNWNETPYWILVGGQAMDRGFTVEGLTVTYMPRGPGVGNADTIQQRGRFFGYKLGYRGYCRIFLEPDVNDAFRQYVEHEEDIRTQLVAHRETGHSLSEWRRQFFLTRNLRPTRNNVLDIGYGRTILGNKWVYPDGPHDTEVAIEANRAIFEQFMRDMQLVQHDGLDRRATEHRNLVDHDISLSRAHEELLTRISVRRLEDSQVFAALLHLIQVHLAQHPEDSCSVFLMAGGHAIRRAYEDDSIKELFQGRQYDRQGTTYPGDRRVRADEGISIQLRYLTLGERGQPPIAENIPHVAVWVPASIARDIVQQPQGG